jgi:hypothetical protein
VARLIPIVIIVVIVIAILLRRKQPPPPLIEIQSLEAKDQPRSALRSGEEGQDSADLPSGDSISKKKEDG